MHRFINTQILSIYMIYCIVVNLTTSCRSTDTDSSIMTFQDDVYETVTRLPGGNWTNGEVTWETNLGEEHVAKEAIMPPAGWEWADAWQVDLSRAVDEVGKFLMGIGQQKLNDQKANVSSSKEFKCTKR